MRLTATTTLLLSAIMTVVACGSDGPVPSPEGATATSKGLAPRAVRVVRPEKHEVLETASAIGSLEAFAEVAVAADVEGPVDRVLVDVGDKVRDGDALVVVDHHTFELRLARASADLEQARAQLDVAERELARKRKLLEDDTISEAAFDVVSGEAELARARVSAAEAARDLAARDLAKATVRAPFDGTIAVRHVEKGARVGIGEPLFELASTDRLKLAFELPERLAVRAGELDSVSFTVPGDDTTYEATRWAIAPVVDTSTRTVELTFVTDNRTRSLRAGFSASVLAAFPERITRWVVPRAAVTLEDLPRLFVLGDGVAHERVIEIGAMGDDVVEVVAGIDGDTPVIADAGGMYEGVPVEASGGGDA